MSGAGPRACRARLVRAGLVALVFGLGAVVAAATGLAAAAITLAATGAAGALWLVQLAIISLGTPAGTSTGPTKATGPRASPLRGKT